MKIGRGERIRTSGLYVPKNAYKLQTLVFMRLPSRFLLKYYSLYYTDLLIKNQRKIHIQNFTTSILIATTYRAHKN